MVETTNDNNKVIDDSAECDENVFAYNFISIPWDDRTQRSKISIAILLVSIFAVTMGMIINNFVTHYKNFSPGDVFNTGDINCNLVKVDEYLYVARVHTVSTQQLMCVGAVISDNSVLVNEICLKSGPVHVHVGSTISQHCKKGFSVNFVERIPHEGVASKSLALLSIDKKMSSCASVASIGGKIEGTRAFVIGRPLRGERSLSRQLVNLHAPYNGTQYGQLINNLRNNEAICVKHLSRCPVRAGDLLVLRGRLLGLASAATEHMNDNKIVCFANASTIKRRLKLLDEDVRVYNEGSFV